MKKLILVLLLFVAQAGSNTVHGIVLTWNRSITANVTYRLYRSTVHNGPYQFVATTPNSQYADYNVKVGRTYYYVATSDNGVESVPSNEAAATVR